MSESAQRNDRNPDPKPRRRGTRAQRAALGAAVFVAALLAFAATMKLLSKPLSEIPAHDKALAGFEGLIAALILVFHRWRITWLCTAAFFAALSGVTLHLLLIGAGSCGCFGKLSIPPAVTLTLDTLIVIAAIALARALGAQRNLLALTAAALVPFVVAGALYSKATAPPPASTFRLGDRFKDIAPPPDRETAAPAPGEAADAAEPPDFDPIDLGATGALLLLPRVADRFLEGAPEPEWMADLRAAATAGANDPAWLIFVYDPFCEVCMRFQPTMLMYTTDEDVNATPHLRVLLLQKADLRTFDIPDWAWPASPTTALIHRGRIIHEWGGEDTPNPFLLHDDIAEQGDAYLRQLRETYTPLIAR
ncbi:MAG: hypothetical protein EA379_10305 [Phycisphaerales bacterium]|nr:MAG: hypothetical protein EA379_10305 [Phycisphaerales bacterium]